MWRLYTLVPCTDSGQSCSEGISKGEGESQGEGKGQGQGCVLRDLVGKFPHIGE